MAMYNVQNHKISNLYCGDDQCFVLQTLHNLGVGLCEVPGKVDPSRLVPDPDLVQPCLLQLDNLQREVGPEAVLVKLDDARQTGHRHLVLVGNLEQSRLIYRSL